MLTRIARTLSYAAATLSVLLLTSSHAFASVYGKGGYSSCGYASNCSPSSAEPPPPVEVTLPSGLEVSINLTDGQVIPRGGYTVTITPLNGQGSSFGHADISIDGKLITSIVPDSTGTAHWDWDPTQNPGSTVTIVIFDTSGNSVSHEFHITIGSLDSAGGSGSTTGIQPGTTTAAPSTNPVQRFVQGLYHGAQSIVRKLPKPVVYTFPYILFILLGVNIFLLLFQLKRELNEYTQLLTRLEREKAATESKRTLMQLVAHYLRTPLTVMSGGIDMLLDNPLTRPSAAKLQTITHHLQVNIETLIEQMRNVSTTKVTTSGDAPSPAIWRQPGLFAPLILIAAVVFSFDYLAQQSDHLTDGQVILATHIIIYTILAVVSYQVFRRLQLRKRDTTHLEQIIATEQQTNQVRDSIVTQALVLLKNDLTQVNAEASSSTGSDADKFIHDGQARFHQILTNLEVAASLRGSHDTAVYTPNSPTSLLANVLKLIQAQAASKRVTIDTQIPQAVAATARLLPDPKLLSFVLQSSIDNAVAYSPERGTVTITASFVEEVLVVSISDQGQGIAADKQPALFQPFFKAEGAETFTHEGMGFSLYLDRLIMIYLGGSIEITSVPHKGTTTTIHIPTQITTA